MRNNTTLAAEVADYKEKQWKKMQKKKKSKKKSSVYTATHPIN